jgi:hypothetical protein
MPVSIYNYKQKTDLENFNQTIAISLDDIKAFIDQVSDVLSVEFANKDHLGIMAALLGVDLNKAEDQYLQRRQLKNALDVIKTKGTIECFQALLYNFGLDLEIIPLWTADFIEETKLTPPFIKITSLPVLSEGLFDITVYNPDLQSDTKQNIFTVS